MTPGPLASGRMQAEAEDDSALILLLENFDGVDEIEDDDGDSDESGKSDHGSEPSENEENGVQQPLRL